MTSRDRCGGFALLAVLVALAAMSTVMVTLCERAGRTALSVKARAAEEYLDRAMVDAEQLAQAWLETTSASAVLPPDNEAAHIQLLDWSHEHAGETLALRIAAYDQFGMAPASVLIDASVLRFGSPSEAIAAVEELHSSGSLPAALGLDDLSSSSWPVFPAQDGVGVGAHVATHQSSPPKINVSTAPVRLLTAAARAAGMGGVGAVLDARAAGLAPPALGAEGGGGGDEPIQFVTSSTSWAFRIDVRKGSRARSWWTVFEGSGTRWTLAQRLAIDA